MRWLPLLLACASCGTSPLISATSDYAVGERTLDFSLVWVGFPVARPLEILSRTRVAQSLPVSVDGPFTVTPSTVELPGGDTAVLVVRFAPELAGVVHGSLRVGDLEVSLVAEGAAPPDCGVGTTCRPRAFDPASGACVDQLLPDGAACEAGTCLENGQCRAGECVGSVRSCDDRNACTRDTCSPEAGCQHLDVAASCPAATDACHAAMCDPLRGCDVALVPDGTPCGEVSCALANVCMQGRCVGVVPPDGFVCAPETPCQDRGVCRAQSCERPQAHELAPAWSYSPRTAELVFEGVSDPQGNLWWVECEQGEVMSCGAVSYTRDGFERVRGPAVSGMTWSRTVQLFDEGRFVFATSNGVVVAVDGATGAEQWRVDVSALIGVWYHALQLTSDGRGRLWLSEVEYWDRCALDHDGTSMLVQLDAQTGAVTTSTPVLISGSPVADEQGNLFATLLTMPAQLASWSPSGAQRFSVDGGTDTVAVAQGRIVTAGNQVFDNASGVELTAWSAWAHDLLSNDVLQVGGQTIRLGREPIGCFPPPVMPSVELVLYDAANPWGRVLGLVAGPMFDVVSPVMAQHDTVLVAGRPTPGTAELKALTTAGAERFACRLSELPLDSLLGPGVAFTGDRYALVQTPVCPTCLRAPPPVLRVFDTTGLGVATSGWVGPRGTPGRAGHPR